jgi:hypothetical protein
MVFHALLKKVSCHELVRTDRQTFSTTVGTPSQKSLLRKIITTTNYRAKT